MLYEQTFGTEEYFCFDYLKPDTPASLTGWRLDAQRGYQSILPDGRGWLWSEKLGLWLGKWHGTVLRDTTIWLRFYTADGDLALTAAEAAAAAQALTAERAEVAEEQAEAAIKAQQAAEEQAQAEAAIKAQQAAEEQARALQAELVRLQEELAQRRER
jgi:hypothetical protein